MANTVDCLENINDGDILSKLLLRQVSSGVTLIAVLVFYSYSTLYI